MIDRQDPEVVEQLRSNMQGLLAELSDLSRRHDEVLSASDSDQLVIRDLDNQLKEYKRKYELAKTELRNVKGTFEIVYPTQSKFLPSFRKQRLNFFCKPPNSTINYLYLQMAVFLTSM